MTSATRLLLIVVPLLPSLANGNDCVEYKNPNSNEIPMVSPPLELTGSWIGSNCGLGDAAPTAARLEMQTNGSNVWFFDGLPQTGDGVEAVIGWHCIDVGVGYWWGKVNGSDVLWCNLFQVAQQDGQLIYINYAYGDEGVGALSTGACPTNLDLVESQKPLQASFAQELSSSNVEFVCNVPAGQDQPSCNSRYTNDKVPNPFSSDSPSSLPIINKETCEALLESDKSWATPTMRTTTTMMKWVSFLPLLTHLLVT